MAAAAGDDGDIFVYMGGDQQVPRGVRRAKIHKSVKIVRARAFQYCYHLVYVEFHDGVEIIEQFAFYCCSSLRGAVRLMGIKIIKQAAFYNTGLTDVEFGDKLETLERSALNSCFKLKNIRIPSVETIGKFAFAWCLELSNIQFGEGLKRLQEKTFMRCDKLKQIALPLKNNMFEGGLLFGYCPMLTTVDLVGGVHNTVASLHMESWRNETRNKIKRINEVLPTLRSGEEKAAEVQQWMESVIRLLDECKDKHHKILKEATTLLELALWKANLGDNRGGQLEREGVRITRGSKKRARREICVTSGASIVIKNVLPYLQLLE